MKFKIGDKIKWLFNNVTTYEITNCTDSYYDVVWYDVFDVPYVDTIDMKSEGEYYVVEN